MKGKKNYEFIKKDGIASGKPAIRFEISKVRIINTQFKFLNKQHNKKIEFTLLDDVILLNNYSDGLEADFKGKIFIKGLLFKLEKGPFLNNVIAKFNMKALVSFSRKEIFLKPSLVDIERQKYNISAFIELKNKKQLALSIDGKNINYTKAISLFNYGIKKGLSNIKMTKSIDAKSLIIVQIGEQQDPIILAKLSSNKNDAMIGNSKIPYSDLDFNASIISLDTSLLRGNAIKAKVILKNLEGKVYGFPFYASVMITNFNEPFINISTNLFINAKQIEFKPGKNFDLNGSATALINYYGPVKKLNSQQFLDTPMVLNAKVKFNNVSYRKKTQPFVYTISGNALVINNFLKFDDLFLKTNGGNVKLKGSVNNFVKFSLGQKDGFKANLIATTNHFDLTNFIQKKNVKSVETKSNNSKIKISEKIASTTENDFEFDISLIAKKFLVRKVIANDANIKLHYKNKLLEIQSLEVNTCSGKLSAKGSIYDMNKIEANVTTDNINVNQLFEQFENFGQKAIQSNNIQGKVSLEAKMKMELDEKMEVIGNSISSHIQFKLKDGHLLKYEPLQKISDYIFKNRDFEDISFTEINETFTINRFKMDIQEMEIASNVLNLFMSGVYNFKDYSNINILIPWNNLKKRGKNYIPKNSEKAAEDLKGLKIHYSGMPNKMKVGLEYK